MVWTWEQKCLEWVGILQHGSPWSAEYFQRTWWCVRLPGVVFIGIQRSARQKPQNKTWYRALAVLISTPYLLEPWSSSPNPSQNCLNMYGSEFLPPLAIKTKEKLLPLHNISLAQELVLWLSRWLKWKIEFSQWATNKWTLMNTEIHSLTNKREQTIERQSRCV